MTNKNELVQELKQKANIKDGEKVSPEHSKEILQLYQNGELQEQHLEALTNSSPEFSDSIISLVRELPRLAEKSGDINKKLLEQINHLNQTTTVLKTIASEVKNDNVKLEIAKLVVEVANQYNKTLETINKNNNNSLQRIFGGIAMTVVTIAAIFNPNSE